jgi:hypothetical protein
MKDFGSKQFLQILCLKLMNLLVNKNLLVFI